MKFIRQIAVGVLVAELLLATVLLVGLMVPLPGRVELKIVESGSMEPTVHVGSVVVVAPASDYAVGDIITFGNDTRKRIPTTHRIYDIARKDGSIRYITKGDANEEADPGQTAYEEVIGRVVLTVPRLGYVLAFARSEQGFMFMVVIPAMFVMLDELLSIFAVFRSARAGNTEHRAQNTERVANNPAHQHCHGAAAHESGSVGVAGARVNGTTVKSYRVAGVPALPNDPRLCEAREGVAWCSGCAMGGVNDQRLRIRDWSNNLRPLDGVVPRLRVA